MAAETTSQASDLAADAHFTYANTPGRTLTVTDGAIVAAEESAPGGVAPGAWNSTRVGAISSTRA